MWKHKRLQIPKTTLRKNRAGRIRLPDFRLHYIATVTKTVCFWNKNTIESQKPKRKELKHNAKENYQTTKVKTKKEHRRNTKLTGKQGLKWQ